MRNEPGLQDGGGAVGGERNPALRRLHDYWLDKRGNRPMPSRKDIDPFDLVSVLPHLLLVDVLGPVRFRYRLFGTALVDLYRREMTGQFVDDIRSEALRHAALAAYQDIVTLREPAYACLEFLMHGPLVAYDRILMPLSNDGESVSMVIGAIMRRPFKAR